MEWLCIPSSFRPRQLSRQVIELAGVIFPVLMFGIEPWHDDVRVDQLVEPDGFTSVFS